MPGTVLSVRIVLDRMVSVYNYKGFGANFTFFHLPLRHVQGIPKLSARLPCQFSGHSCCFFSLVFLHVLSICMYKVTKTQAKITRQENSIVF